MTSVEINKKKKKLSIKESEIFHHLSLFDLAVAYHFFQSLEIINLFFF